MLLSGGTTLHIPSAVREGTRLTCCKHRHLFQTLADNEDRHNQLTDTLETHKYHFEQAVKVANFPEVSRLKELMQRTQFDIGERYS